MAENGDDGSWGEWHDEWQNFKKSVREISNKKFNTEKINVKKEDKINFKKGSSEYNSPQSMMQDYGKFNEDDSLNTSIQIEINNFKGIDKNLYRDIIFGKIEPHAKLDLHGCKIAEAHSAVIAFIKQCFSDRRRLVLIITGKGRGESENTIRGNLEGFLNSQQIKSMILFASKAASRHGGVGAFYVFLRKKS